MRAIPYDEVRTALALWLPYVVIAGICLAAGLSAIALSLLRARDRLLFWVGVFPHCMRFAFSGKTIWCGTLLRRPNFIGLLL